MRRGDLFLVPNPPDDPRPNRVFLVVSRNRFLETGYATASCVAVYSNEHGFETEVPVGVANGLKWPSVARCDEIVRVHRDELRVHLGVLDDDQLRQLSRALAIALEISPTDIADL